MAISITQSVSERRKEDILHTIASTTLTEPYLSARSVSVLKKAYDQKRLFFASEGDRVAGWILRISYSFSVQELCAGYVEPSYRGRGVFSQLLTHTLPLAQNSIIVTFNGRLYELLVHQFNFTQSSLLECVYLTRGAFLPERIGRIGSIISHYQRSRPYYVIHRRS